VSCQAIEALNKSFTPPLLFPFSSFLFTLPPVSMTFKKGTTVAHSPELPSWDSPHTEAECEVYKAVVVLYRWKDADNEWVDMGPGKLVILERTLNNNDNSDTEDAGQTIHQLIFRSTGTFKVRSNHVITQGGCQISAEFPAGVEVAVKHEASLGAAAPPARLCFSFEEDVSGVGPQLATMATEFAERYRASQTFATEEEPEATRTLPTLRELLRAKVLSCGKEAMLLYVSDDGKEFTAELMGDGRILWGTKILKTVSGFVYAVRLARSKGKYVPLENGWNLVEYNGKKLQELRMAHLQLMMTK